VKLTWFGPQIADNITNATKAGIDQTMADCVAHAQGRAPVDTGWLRNNITFRPAIRQGNRLVGRWGNVDGPDYALINELRVNYLRRAADSQYPSLPSRIRENR
jgi:hypothetical protein